MFDVVAEAYNRGHHAAVTELGALSDRAWRLIDETTLNAQAVDRLAAETADAVTATHRGILRAVVGGFRAVVTQVAATPLLGIGTRQQAAQDAMRRFAERGLRSFTDRAGRSWQLTSTQSGRADRSSPTRCGNAC
ncbi:MULTISPECIES: phage minor capsid protein [Streptomyces]|uniref:phage minor capsid protein n=1 Tax=Streptomyces lycopersici TaxID=2974589 RepID=UPI0021D38250|nr:phage minor capsid protein [Streptomyces sp. NEAU-383]